MTSSDEPDNEKGQKEAPDLANARNQRIHPPLYQGENSHAEIHLRRRAGLCG